MVEMDWEKLVPIRIYMGADIGEQMFRCSQCGGTFYSENRKYCPVCDKRFEGTLWDGSEEVVLDDERSN